MRSRRVAQACDVISGRSVELTEVRHDLEVPPTLTLRVRAAATVEMHRGALSKPPASPLRAQGR